MLAEKFILLLETLRKHLPEPGETYIDGAPRVVSKSPHVPVQFPAKLQAPGR